MKKSPKKTKKVSPQERIALALEDIAKSLSLQTSFKELHEIMDDVEEIEQSEGNEHLKDNYFTITERPDLKTSQIMDIMRSKFKVWSYYADARLDKEFPAPKEATTRYFKKTIEPDADLLGKSAKECDAMGVPGITLRERLLMEIQYFDETGNHLDVISWTICSGSRYSDGYVPYMCLDASGEVSVGWCGLGNSGGTYGVRRAVTL